VLLFLAALPGCSAGEPRAAASQAPAKAAEVSVCTLVTKPEVEAGVGRPVTAMGPLNPKYPNVSCKLEFSPTSWVELSLATLAQSPGITTSAALAELIKTSTFPEGMDWKPVDGFPVPATELAGAGIVIVQKGPARLQVTAFDVPLDAARAVARTAAARMP
jgi:hypothetical protein